MSSESSEEDDKINTDNTDNNIVDEPLKFPQNCVLPSSTSFMNIIGCEYAKDNSFPSSSSSLKMKTKRTRVERFRIINAAKEVKLRYAASTNNYELVKYYLNQKVNPNGADNYQRTALHLASCRGDGYYNVVELLLQYGANPNLRDSLGNTPLHLAVCTNHTSIIRLLIQSGADLTSINGIGRNPIELARGKLNLIINSTRVLSSNTEEREKLIKDIQNIVQMMIAYWNKQQKYIDDLNDLSSRLGALTTEEEVKTEVHKLFDNLEQLSITTKNSKT